MLAQRVVLVDIQNNKRTRGNCISLSRCICICIYSCSCICCSNCISVPAAFPFGSTGYNFLPFAYFIMTATPRVVKDEEARRERGWGCQAVERERERESAACGRALCAPYRVSNHRYDCRYLLSLCWPFSFSPKLMIKRWLKCICYCFLWLDWVGVGRREEVRLVLESNAWSA